MNAYRVLVIWMLCFASISLHAGDGSADNGAVSPLSPLEKYISYLIKRAETADNADKEGFEKARDAFVFIRDSLSDFNEVLDAATAAADMEALLASDEAAPDVSPEALEAAKAFGENAPEDADTAPQPNNDNPSAVSK